MKPANNFHLKVVAIDYAPNQGATVQLLELVMNKDTYAFPLASICGNWG